MRIRALLKHDRGARGKQAASLDRRALGVFFSRAQGRSATPCAKNLQRQFSPLLRHISLKSSATRRCSRDGSHRSGKTADSFDLTPEQARVLMLTHRGFVRAGRGLDGGGPMPRIGKRSRNGLAVAGDTVSPTNLLADERSWFHAAWRNRSGRACPTSFIPMPPRCWPKKRGQARVSPVRGR